MCSEGLKLLIRASTIELKVQLIKKGTIEDYVAANPRSRPSFTTWLNILRVARWESLSDMKGSFSSADILGKGSQRVVFNIGGNNYRVICKYVFGERCIRLFIQWVGTHAEYDELCKDNEQYTVRKY